jgi:D-alanine transaminase
MAEPLPTCLLNGEFLPLRAARISPLDRSFLYGDGVYEVFPVFGGRPFRFEQHLDRLDRSLAAIRMDNPHPRQDWRAMTAGLLAHNRAAAAGGDVYVYLQVSRGAEYGRSHAPLPQVPRTVFGFCAPLPRPSAARLAEGFACTTAQDTRWARCDIKSVALLANVLLRQAAQERGADEALLVRGERVLEGSSSSVFVVRDGVVATPPDGPEILPGTTRDAILELCAGDPRSEIRPVTRAELQAADEVWIASAGRGLLPVCRVDDRPVGSGRPGPLWRELDARLRRHLAEIAATPAL